MGINHRKVHPYLLYTRYPLLYPLVRRGHWSAGLLTCATSLWLGEHAVQLQNSSAYTFEVLSEITPFVLNENHLRGMFWERYLAPSISAFGNHFNALSQLEQSYYLTLYNFIVKEQYISKSARWK